MKYRKLGKSSLEVSEIAFGCMSMGTDQAMANKLVAMAIDGGINLFDTANIYDHGDNEKILGKALGTNRQKVLIASKVGNQRRADNSGLDWNPRKEHIVTEVDQSLMRLGTDYIDLYQLHGGMITDPIDEIIEAFDLLVEQGKIRYYGISSIRPNVIREYVKRSRIVSVMMQYSLLDRRPEETAFPLLLAQGIGTLIRGSIAKGLLAGKAADSFTGYDKADVQKMTKAVNSISSDQRSTMQTAVNYVLQQQVVSSAVIGIRTQDQLIEALRVPDRLPLTAHEVAWLSQILHPNFYEEHR
jgi:aryl-alcohol dehydrogenase-like predicted oxidoreductase